MCRRVVVSVFAVFITLVVALPVEVLACGDKFLVPSRGTRFRARAVTRDAAVLLFAQPGSALDQTLRALAVEARLLAEGYRPRVVTSRVEFDRLLEGGGWDVVVVDLAEASALASRLSTTRAPVVLPVAHDPKSAAADAARAHYRRIVKAPRKPEAFLEAVDGVIATRARTPRAKAGAGIGE